MGMKRNGGKLMFWEMIDILFSLGVLIFGCVAFVSMVQFVFGGKENSARHINGDHEEFYWQQANQRRFNQQVTEENRRFFEQSMAEDQRFYDFNSFGSGMF